MGYPPSDMGPQSIMRYGGEPSWEISQKGLCAVAALSITVIALVGGCNHSRSTPKDVIAASDEVSQVSQELVGKRITIHGKFSLLGKIGPFIVLDNQQKVYISAKGSFEWGKPYTEMDDKLIAATGTLRFYHAPDTKKSKRVVQVPPDFFYFEVESSQLRIIGAGSPGF